jgi:hypothetical protein
LRFLAKKAGFRYLSVLTGIFLLNAEVMKVIVLKYIETDTWARVAVLFCALKKRAAKSLSQTLQHPIPVLFRTRELSVAFLQFHD